MQLLNIVNYMLVSFCAGWFILYLIRISDELSGRFRKIYFYGLSMGVVKSYILGFLIFNSLYFASLSDQSIETLYTDYVQYLRNTISSPFFMIALLLFLCCSYYPLIMFISDRLGVLESTLGTIHVNIPKYLISSLKVFDAIVLLFGILDMIFCVLLSLYTVMCL